ncbi:hypothetical protein DI487_02730 [Flavobacterium sediminis]|uniref:Uncharacterized protein n=1 Tax=Flavobacterium sediminis TaxID=2201181 RepID=A0A2U8QRW1_9FLAO|nr:hypothetical protein [Flavobacterium sediminis]AWM12888.1 hypothetical protein DI487_02730 [Flavobacterium sediminis]
MSEFNNVMSNKSDLELYEILYYKKNSYVPEALISAENEFKSRNISKAKISEFEQQLQSRANKKLIRENQKELLIQKTQDLGKLFIPTEKDTLTKSLLSLCIFLSISYLFYFISNFSLTITLLNDLNDWDLSMTEHFLPLILFPIGIFGLWKIKKYGWFIIVSLLTYYSFATIYAGISSYKLSYGNEGGVYSQLDNLFPKPNLINLILRLVIIGGLVFFLHRNKILQVYKIKKTNGITLVLVIVVLTTMIWWSLI